MTSSPTISATFHEALRQDSKIDVSTGGLTVSGNSQLVDEFTVSFWPDSQLPEGPHSAVATVANSAGGTSSVAWNFIIDRRAPILTLDSLSRGSTVRRSFGVRLVADDANAVTGVSARIIGITGFAPLSQDGLAWQGTVETGWLENGEVTIEFVAGDVAGNIGSLAVPVRVENAYAFFSPKTFTPLEGLALKSDPTAFSHRGDGKETQILSVMRPGFSYAAVWETTFKVDRSPSDVYGIVVNSENRYAHGGTHVRERIFLRNHVADTWEYAGEQLREPSVKLDFIISQRVVAAGNLQRFVGTGGTIRVRFEAASPTPFTAYGDFASLRLTL